MTDIRLAALNEYESVSTFIDQNWKKDHIYTRSRKLFDWTFLDNPAWEELHYSISIAVHRENIVGMLGTIPFRLNIYGAIYDACWLVNWLVKPEERKGRVGLDLLKLFSKDYRYDTISFGINDAVSRLYTALRWQHMPPIERVVWFNPEKILEVKHLLIETNANVSHDAIMQYLRSNVSEVRQFNSRVLDPIQTLESLDWDKNGWGKWKNNTIGCCRDSKYLTWRYLMHPIYTYQLRMIPDGENIGLIVWRVENTSKKNIRSELESFYPIARIVEFLPASDVNALHLVSDFIAHSFACGVVAADFYCHNRGVIDMLQKFGFSNSNANTNISLSNYANPVAIGKIIRSAININKGHQVDANSADWYWTRSDSDQDRPN